MQYEFPQNTSQNQSGFLKWDEDGRGTIGKIRVESELGVAYRMSWLVFWDVQFRVKMYENVGWDLKSTSNAQTLTNHVINYSSTCPELEQQAGITTIENELVKVIHVKLHCFLVNLVKAS